MAVRRFTDSETALLAGSVTVASIPVHRDPEGAKVLIVSLKGKDAAYASVLVTPAPGTGEVLGRGDDLEPLLTQSSHFAALDSSEASGPHRRALASGEGQTATTAPADWEITPAQVAVLQEYAEGDFAHIAEEARTGGARAFDEAVSHSGDGFLAYVLREIDTREGCNEGNEMESASYRIGRLVEDMLAMQSAVDNAPTGPAALGA